MAKKDEFVVLSIEQYLALPELPMPAVPNEETPGQMYTVTKAGFFWAEGAACEKHGLAARQIEGSEKFALPTIVVKEDGGLKFYRLPLSLTPWAAHNVQMAMLYDQKPFPATVEFGILRDRHYAEIREIL